MTYHYVWLIWSSAFLLPWVLLYALFPQTGLRCGGQARRLAEIPDRNRVFMDEDSANELGSADMTLRQVGVCRLKGFGGFHRVHELRWGEA